MSFTCLDVAQAANLGESKRVGKELCFPCPNHDDHDPSLEIDQVKDLWICRVCKEGGNAWALAAFLARCHPDEKSKVISWLRGHHLLSDKNGSGNLVRSYIYRDENSTPLFRVDRCHSLNSSKKKYFLQYRPNGNGGWILRVKDANRKLLVRLVPYRLPDFLQKDTVFIVEGEDDVNALWDLDVPATCNPMGAGNWRGEFSQYFTNKWVVIVPDNDAPGERHAFQIASNLFPVAKGIKVVRLPDLPPKGDIRDWIRAWR